jgi:hypothetical protein
MRSSLAGNKFKLDRFSLLKLDKRKAPALEAFFTGPSTSRTPAPNVANHSDDWRILQEAY